ncbi:hypothetical protein NQ317_001790 [Molorchus minor]|uniref:HTH CENPB-type domain-containing protein n=1 Tax=Molorchus minor TaxID=1323400 RepID=A0ABQ9JCJ2_9CUCU|nr:hypothetical protein NQ317_001790 [Molorchus minor]
MAVFYYKVCVGQNGVGQNGMVRNYVKKTDRQQWSNEAMDQAIDAFQLPQTTLERYVKKRKDDPNYVIDKTSGKYQCVFTKEQELELVTYLKDMQKRLFGLTVKELRRLAYQLAVRNGCNHSFNKDTEMAGEDWVQSFMNRNPELSLRRPEATSGARAMGFNRVAVAQFFTLLNQVITEKKITGERIYNCDETGITVIPKQHSRVIANKGQRQVGVLTSAERGNTVTAEICCSAAGNFMPPMLIFPRKRKQQEFELGLPIGGWAEVNESGWMAMEIFLRWFKKFTEFSNARKEAPVLYFLMGTHHIRKTWKLQPLDVAVMRPLSLYYEDEVQKWLRSNPGKVVTLFQISTLFGQAFVNAANMKTALKGFEKTGIWPTNEGIFTDDDFLPAETTNIPIENEIQTCPIPSDNPTKNNETQNPQPEPQPQCSWMPDSPNALIRRPSISSFPALSPEIAMPVPKLKTGFNRVQRKRGKTTILTESPYKAELTEAIEKAKKKDAQKEKVKKNLSGQKQKNVTQLVTKRKKQKIAAKEVESSSDESVDEDDALCLYCNYQYSASTEGWVSCSQCKKWAHNSCAGIDSDDDDSVLICELCTPNNGRYPVLPRKRGGTG